MSLEVPRTRDGGSLKLEIIIPRAFLLARRSFPHNRPLYIPFNIFYSLTPKIRPLIARTYLTGLHGDGTRAIL
ncbi:hypothetical protein CGGC5_v010597 [Colletotrichum fructicola Nara gc5]|uniref:Uncharacterized protein n=1 Tax=Colletotrichum fructicola (strain Nara gc5) TaxID=1213859 RepID=A0A7J6IU45_COLFN|nr:hypothetical protein CGGC5_v010597 [Colletotrichum fructicola Nara gc5]